MGEQKEVSVKEWIAVLFLMVIPIVNLISLLYWAFGEKSFKTNFAKAMLSIVLTFVSIGLIMSIFSIGMLETIEEEPRDPKQNFYDAQMYSAELNTENVQRDLELIDITARHTDTEVTLLNVDLIIKNNSEENTYNRATFEFALYDELGYLVGTYQYELDTDIPPLKEYKTNFTISNIELKNVLNTQSIELTEIN